MISCLPCWSMSIIHSRRHAGLFHFEWKGRRLAEEAFLVILRRFVRHLTRRACAFSSLSCFALAKQQGLMKRRGETRD